MTVTGGAYVGRRGTVVKVKNRVCYVFDEVAQQEFQVFARDLSSTAAKVSANADRSGSTWQSCLLCVKSVLPVRLCVCLCVCVCLSVCMLCVESVSSVLSDCLPVCLSVCTLITG